MQKRLFSNLIGGGLVCLGLVLCLYGLYGRTVPVLKGPTTEEPPCFADEAARGESTEYVTERSIVKDVTIGGIKRWAGGDLQHVYTLNDEGVEVDSTGNEAEKACPT